ncbi:hypothetical protein SAICODRAFT_31374 [Saitoella complicata NRRL Y-17804]|uniref:uncharacterized protein n=1 Tax=Saitoella complicata (strain BCRC 22490 / CBS 7301 / JCM 7358 / NBRC 10748 / NRRL Y-17804) TaxID=698492 RepID=UPI000867C748|nr:uncharacterized protein SAICODRAFT_31374 [Saitoella complicata NRRL Y-17804]ODQ51459.1 hypothetical protein SAICODRAFT_31374 [Saitoella complicata NRRL Y-17804]
MVAKSPASKKSTKSSKAKSAAATVKKASYKSMITDALAALKERNGSSRQAIKQYIKENFDVDTPAFDRLFNNAVRNGADEDYFIQPKGPSGPLKFNKNFGKEESPKPIAKKAADAAKTAKSTAKTAVKEVKKAVAEPKKTATKAKTAAKKVTKKVEDPLKKAKGGRVTKNSASKKTAGKVAPKKAATRKTTAARKA